MKEDTGDGEAKTHTDRRRKMRQTAKKNSKNDREKKNRTMREIGKKADGKQK